MFFNSSFITLLQASGIINPYNTIFSHNASYQDAAALAQIYQGPNNLSNMPSRLPTSGFHEGETSMHEALRVPHRDFAAPEGLPGRYGARVLQSPLVAVGTLDERGRPWTSVWGGERGFAKPVAEDVLGVDAVVDAGDPVFQQLWKGGNPFATQAGVGENEDDDAGTDVVRPNGGEGKIMSALAIDLETRDRVKIMGRMVVGTADRMAARGTRASVRMAVVVEQSLGNCPKYLNKKEIVPNPDIGAAAVEDGGDGRAGWGEVGEGEGLPLGSDELDLIARADLLFISSEYGGSMDTNHRGGAPGFVRVMRNEEGGVELVYPEYSGNRLYQTLGNIKMNPLVGLVIPDFETSDVLHLTGSASILIGEEASSVLPRTKLALKITVSAARFTKNGLSFRGRFIDYSPYNPPVRHLLSEREAHAAGSGSSPSSSITAHLVKREKLTPDVLRCTFRLERKDAASRLAWQAGQYLTFSFESELDDGYAHMNDGDPQSLNDDYVRTFTISSPPPIPQPESEDESTDVEAQITVKVKGPATRFLSRHNDRIPLEIPVLGIGGEEAFRMPTDKGRAGMVYIAAGVGITPLLAQAPELLRKGAGFTLLWSLRGQDVPLAVDSFRRIPGLAGAARVFLTAGPSEGDAAELRRLGVGSVEVRRMAETDLDGLTGKGGQFYLCTGPAMLEMLKKWLEGEKEVEWEDFGY